MFYRATNGAEVISDETYLEVCVLGLQFVLYSKPKSSMELLGADKSTRCRFHLDCSCCFVSMGKVCFLHYKSYEGPNLLLRGGVKQKPIGAFGVYYMNPVDPKTFGHMDIHLYRVCQREMGLQSLGFEGQGTMQIRVIVVLFLLFKSFLVAKKSWIVVITSLLTIDQAPLQNLLLNPPKPGVLLLSMLQRAYFIYVMEKLRSSRGQESVSRVGSLRMVSMFSCCLFIRFVPNESPNKVHFQALYPKLLVKDGRIKSLNRRIVL